MNHFNSLVSPAVTSSQQLQDNTFNNSQQENTHRFATGQLNGDEHQCTKSNMKLKTGKEDMVLTNQGSLFDEDVNNTVLLQDTACKTMPGHELSMSLPNLCSDVDTENMNQENEKRIRGSLSDIYDSPSEAHHISWKKSLKELTEKLKMYRLSLEDCPSCVSDERHNQEQKCNSDKITTSSQTPCLELLKQLKSLQKQPQDLKINVSQCNNRLSAVLENMPLLYIPHTKQLISVTSTSGTDSERKSMPSKSEEDNSCKNTPVESSAAHHQIPSGCLSTTTPQTSTSTSSTLKNDISSDNKVTSPSGSGTAGHNEISNQSIASLSKTAYLSSPDLESSLALSQDSDASSRSEHTVIHQEELHSQGKMDDFEEECVDELTKINVDRDSPRGTLQRTNTMGSLSMNDGSSFSSISSISTGTDFSASAASYSDEYMEMKGVVGDVDESGFMEVNLHSRNTFERSRNSSKDSGIDETQYHGAKPKRRGIAGFFTRNLFSRKPKEPATEEAGHTHSAPGWKLFGRIPPKEIPQKDPNLICEEFKVKAIQHPAPSGGHRQKKTDVEVSSTTALILEPRPKGLPSKTPEEEERHRLEYEAMVQAAKKREMKEAKLRKKQLAAQLKLEDSLAAALKVWNSEILTSWENMHNCKKARDLWWAGIPPAVRGKVWKLAIGNELNLTSELYEICLNRAQDRLKLIDESGDIDGTQEPTSNKEGSVELIKLDVSRTFPQLCIFQRGGPYHELLQGLLGAYACYRPDVGYVQGMSFIAAVLLLNMEVADAFICFANLLNRPCQIAFFRLDENLMKCYFETYEEFFKENLPKLYAHFNKQGLTSDLYIIDWMFTLYAKSLPLDVASRVWDVFCRDGEEFLFRTALGILRMYEEILLNMDFILLAQFLTKLPEDLSGDNLFHCVETINMMIDKRRFNQVLAANRENKEAS